MSKRIKVAAGVALLLACMGILALTLFRPITAKVYHRICSLYTEITTKQAVDAIYEYEPESSLTYNVALEKLPEPACLSVEEQTLYDQTVSVLLKEDLWTARDMYDASHYLMVPMHYAFRSGDTGKIEEFHEFFTRFFEDVSGSDSHSFSEQEPSVSLMQFYYWCCEYLRLCALTGSLSSSPDGMYEYLYQQMEYLYIELPGNWSTEENCLTRAEQILLHKEYSYSYYSALSDVDFFPLASLCDLRIVAKISGMEDTQLLQKAAILAYRIFTDPTLITQTGQGGYLFQVGVWKDYGDYEYAGNTEITPEIQPLTREDIVEDSSHFTRQALWLTSFQQAQDYLEQYDLFQTRREQLASQLVNYVINYVDGVPLATTFMDGTCGVYRYSYNTEGTGHQGYSLSGTLLLGWWSFLDDPRITQVYEDILAQFPMNAGLDNPYYDYANTRERNPFFDANTAFDNGMMECLVTLATKISVD